MAALLLRAGTAAATGAPRPWVPPRWPQPGPDPHPGSLDPAGAALPVLSFGESELAQIAAACAMDAAREAREACAAEAATSGALALEQMAITLAGAVQTRHEIETRCLHQAIDLAQAVARALQVDTEHSRSEAVADALRVMLATLPRQSPARIVVASDCAPTLRAALPEIAAHLGCDGRLEVEGDPRLPAGAVQLMWPGGWLEHAPAVVQQQLAGLLTACRAVAGSTAPAEALVTKDGDKHGHE